MRLPRRAALWDGPYGAACDLRPAGRPLGRPLRSGLRSATCGPPFWRPLQHVYDDGLGAQFVEIAAPDEFIPAIAAPFRHQAAGIGQVG